VTRPLALAVCTTALGDTLMCTPVLADLARSFTVDVVAHQRWRGVLGLNPHIRRVFSYRNNPLARAYLTARLAPTRYKKLLILHANEDFLKLLARLRYDEAACAQNFPDPPPDLARIARDPQEHFVAQRLKLSRWAGAPGLDGPLEVFLSDQERAAGQDWLSRRSLSGKSPLIFLCPGAALVYKRWPIERFARLAAMLAAQGAGVVVMGSAAERPLFARIAADCPRVAAALGLDLRLAGALLQQADLLITNDTGPMHLAQAVGAKVLAIFGPSSPQGVGPRGQVHRILSVPPIHQPCRTKDCTHPQCLGELSAEDVMAQARQMLAEAAGE